MTGRELCDAATANFVTHAAWAASRSRIARVDSSPSLAMVDSGLMTDTFNLVCGARLRPHEVAPTVARIVEHFRSVARSFSWWLCPGDEPDDLAQALARAGLEEQETELAMSLEIGDVAPGSPVPEGVEIQEATSTGEIAVFARINAENWDPPDPAVEAFYRVAASSLLDPDTPQRVFVARGDGEPVAALELTMSSGVGGIYNLSTRAAHRRRGIGAALLRHACRRAEELGVATVVLQASPAGASLYRSFGFREFGMIREFKPPRA